MLKVFTLIIVLSFSVFIFAQNAESGFYFGYQPGASLLSTPETATQTGQSALKGSRRYSFSYNVNAGYQYRLKCNLLLGWEIAYQDDGFSTLTYASGNEYKITSTDVSFLLTTTYNITNDYNVFLKGGITSVTQEYSIYNISRPSGIDPFSKTQEILPVISLGLGYKIAGSFDLYLAYRHLFGNDLSGTDDAFIATSLTVGSNQSIYKDVARIDAVHLGLKYNFK